MWFIRIQLIIFLDRNLFRFLSLLLAYKCVSYLFLNPSGSRMYSPRLVAVYRLSHSCCPGAAPNESREFHLETFRHDFLTVVTFAKCRSRPKSRVCRQVSQIVIIRTVGLQLVAHWVLRVAPLVIFVIIFSCLTLKDWLGRIVVISRI